MIKLINNELNKIKKSKLLFVIFLFIIVIILLNRYSKDDLFNVSYNLIQFVGIVISILFSGIICSEIDNGTFRFYLTKPYNRIKIYLSKLITIVLCTLIIISVIVLTVMIIKRSYNTKYLINYYKCSIPLIFVSIYILYLSTKFKSNVFVSSITIITLSFSLILSQLLFGLNFKIIEYTFLPYLDLSLFNDKSLIIDMNKLYGINLSVNNGIIIDIIYSIILLIFGTFKFNKKDIKN